MMTDESNDRGVVRIPPADELDLHHFHPRDVKALLGEFISMCLEAEIAEIRIVHGRGRSVQKKIVHGELLKNPAVLGFHDERGNWGATIVMLRPKPRAKPHD